jgi:hypothetical protein
MIRLASITSGAPTMLWRRQSVTSLMLMCGAIILCSTVRSMDLFTLWRQ